MDLEWLFPIAFRIVREKFPREKMSIGNGGSSMTAAGAVIGLIIGGEGGIHRIQQNIL